LHHAPESPRLTVAVPRRADLMRRRLFPIVVGWLGLALVVTACARDKRVDEQAQRLAKLQAAYDAVATLQSAADAGVSYEDYSKQLPTASAALLTYQAEDAEARDIAAHLSAAMYAYQNALRAWAVKYDECPDCAWRKFVNSHPQFATEEPSPEYAVSVYWNNAKTEMAAARVALDAYKSK
jgi:sulfur transfer complex TusBCD TusB component (DsrH family)